jgi:glycosyltransferase involved in cell wall biosynthesis
MTYRFWQRYLDVFDQVSIVARVRPVDEVAAEFTRLDGPGVSLHALPEYVGPRQYAGIRRALRQSAAAATTPDDAVLFRVGCSPLAAMVESVLDTRQQRYGVEVITDPHMVFAPGAIRHPLRPVFRTMFTRQLQRQCSRAAAATYVTQSSLQQRYPPGAATFATSYSDVDLPPGAFVSSGRSGALLAKRSTIVSIGSMAQVYKGFDVLIDAVARCAHRGVVVNAVLVGDGRYRPELEAQADRLGLRNQVSFTGQLAGGAAVRNQLDQADLFVLASRTEGLPRVMIEAQARGLPCIGTRVGGIPELLDNDSMVPPDDADALASRIMEFLRNPERRASESARNLDRSRAFGESGLQAHRVDFLNELRDRTLAGRARIITTRTSCPFPPRRNGGDVQRVSR